MLTPAKLLMKVVHNKLGLFSLNELLAQLTFSLFFSNVERKEEKEWTVQEVQLKNRGQLLSVIRIRSNYFLDTFSCILMIYSAVSSEPLTIYTPIHMRFNYRITDNRFSQENARLFKQTILAAISKIRRNNWRNIAIFT